MTRSLTLVCILLLVILFIADVCLGTVYITPSEIFAAISHTDLDKPAHYIITQLRLPRALMAVLTGMGLSIAGLLMQTLFRNPLAGPFALGISSGAGLGVALLVLGSGVIGSVAVGFGLVAASMIGSFLVLLLIIFLSLRVKNTMGLLIVGLMVGSLSSAVVGILAYFTPSEDLQRYVFWTLGSLSNLRWSELGLLAVVVGISLLALLFIIKPLNNLLLGERYALSLGSDLKTTRWLTIVITSLLAGGITAYAGPIAFIGLAVPHIARMVMPSINHRVILPFVMLIGAALMLFCDLVSQLPFVDYTIPINTVTTLLGAPVVIWLIIRKKNLHF